MTKKKKNGCSNTQKHVKTKFICDLGIGDLIELELLYILIK